MRSSDTVRRVQQVSVWHAVVHMQNGKTAGQMSKLLQLLLHTCAQKDPAELREGDVP